MTTDSRLAGGAACPLPVTSFVLRVCRGALQGSLAGSMAQGAGGRVCTATAGGASRRLPRVAEGMEDIGSRGSAHGALHGSLRKQRLSTSPRGQSHSALLGHTCPRLQRVNSRFSLPQTAAWTLPSVSLVTAAAATRVQPLRPPSWALAGAHDRCAE